MNHQKFKGHPMLHSEFKTSLGYKRPCLKQKGQKKKSLLFWLIFYILPFRIVYSSNKSIKNYEEEILKKMKVESVMPETKPDVSFQDCGDSSTCSSGKHEIPEDITGGGSSFISSGEIFCLIFKNFIATDLIIFWCSREKHACKASLLLFILMSMEKGKTLLWSLYHFSKSLETNIFTYNSTFSFQLLQPQC